MSCDSILILVFIRKFLIQNSDLCSARDSSINWVFFPKTVVLGMLMRSIGNKNTILLGLGFQILQLAWYGFGSQSWSVHTPARTHTHNQGAQQTLQFEVTV